MGCRGKSRSSCPSVLLRQKFILIDLTPSTFGCIACALFPFVRNNHLCQLLLALIAHHCCNSELLMEMAALEFRFNVTTENKFQVECLRFSSLALPKLFKIGRAHV